jgi:hypothetical protein
MESSEDTMDRKRLHAVVLFVVLAISICYMASHLKVGWVPHDEGTLGLSAERVLQGQLPHRDFDDYTGGLTFVHAAAFRMFGISSMSMRFVLFAFFVVWVPAVFYVAAHFGSPIPAGAVTLLAVAWSVPNYPGPMPSWYNLFFATWGMAALVRYLDTGSRRWLFAAGLFGGFSFLAKVAAAYYVAGALLFFIYHEQSVANERNQGVLTRARWYSVTMAAGLIAFLLLLFRMVRTIPGVSGPVYFILPTLGLVVLLLAREFAGVPGKNGERFVELGRLCAHFLAGMSIPLVLFLLPYASAHAVHDLYRGLLATPNRAIRFASFDPHNPLTMISMLPFILLLFVAYESGRVGRLVCGLLLGTYGGGILFLAGKTTLAYYLGWCALGTAIPATILVGAVALSRYSAAACPNRSRHQQVMLLLSITALCSLIQFPFSAPIYFFYVAPLLFLSAMALVSLTRRPPTFAFAVVIGIYLLFPALPVTGYQMGISHAQDGKTERLDIPRAGGLRVDSSDARLYDALVPLVQSHAVGKFIYAAPDCPEVYFLSGLQSPSRHYFYFAENGTARIDRTLAEFNDLGINAVAINGNPRVSGAMSTDLREALAHRYPHSEDLNAFEVRWKD